MRQRVVQDQRKGSEEARRRRSSGARVAEEEDCEEQREKKMRAHRIEGNGIDEEDRRGEGEEQDPAAGGLREELSREVPQGHEAGGADQWIQYPRYAEP